LGQAGAEAGPIKTCNAKSRRCPAGQRRLSVPVSRCELRTIRDCGQASARGLRKGFVSGEPKLLYTLGTRIARAQSVASRCLKMNPPFATGPSLGRDAKVSRFAAGLCAAISIRTPKLFEVHRSERNESGRQLRSPYCLSDAMRLQPKQRYTLIKGLHPIAGSLPTGCISAWQFSHSRVSRTRSAI
jgi:hypothetical protein